MATIIPYNPWRENLAASIISPILGNWFKQAQEANQNRKMNAARGRINEDLNMLTAPQPMSEPQGYNADGWTQTFHQNTNPIADFDANAASITPPRVPTMADIQRAMAENLANPRFSMLDPKAVQDMMTPYINSMEAQRVNDLKSTYAQNLRNANGWNDYMRTAANAAMEGAMNDNTFKTIEGYAEHMTPHYQFTEMDAGNSKHMLASDPITGRVYPMYHHTVYTSPNTAATLANQRYIADQEADVLREELADKRTVNAQNYSIKERELASKNMPQYNIQAVNGKLYYVSNDPNVPPKPFMIDGNHMDAPQNGVQYTERDKAAIEQLNKDLTQIDSELSYWYEEKAAAKTPQGQKWADDNIARLQRQREGVRGNIYSILFPQQTSQAPQNQSQQQQNNSALSDDIGANMLGVKSATVSTPFWKQRSRADGSTYNHKGIDYVMAKDTPIKVDDLGIPMTVTKVANDPKGYGNYVDIEGDINGHKIKIRMAHMGDGTVKVKQGQQVNPGDIIGSVGNTGNSRGKNGGYHLHLETMIDGEYVDPQKFRSKLSSFRQSQSNTPITPPQTQPQQPQQQQPQEPQNQTQQSETPITPPQTQQNNSNSKSISQAQYDKFIKEVEAGKVEGITNREEADKWLESQGYSRVENNNGASTPNEQRQLSILNGDNFNFRPLAH